MKEKLLKVSLVLNSRIQNKKKKLGKPTQLMGSFRVGLGKFSLPCGPLFSTRETKLQWDEYGEVFTL